MFLFLSLKTGCSVLEPPPSPLYTLKTLCSLGRTCRTPPPSHTCLCRLVCIVQRLKQRQHPMQSGKRIRIEMMEAPQLSLERKGGAFILHAARAKKDPRFAGGYDTRGSRSLKQLRRCIRPMARASLSSSYLLHSGEREIYKRGESEQDKGSGGRHTSHPRTPSKCGTNNDSSGMTMNSQIRTGPVRDTNATPGHRKGKTQVVDERKRTH